MQSPLRQRLEYEYLPGEAADLPKISDIFSIQLGNSVNAPSGQSRASIESIDSIEPTSPVEPNSPTASVPSSPTTSQIPLELRLIEARANRARVDVPTNAASIAPSNAEGEDGENVVPVEAPQLLDDADLVHSIQERIRSTMIRAHMSGMNFACVAVDSQGRVNGEGILVNASGATLEGKFSQDMCSAIDATCLAPGLGFRGSGNVVNGNYTGLVELQTPLGQFAGDMQDGAASGVGTWSRRNGTWYHGQWHQGLRHGEGEEHYEDQNASYTGGWTRDMRHGKGELRTPDLVYTGEWRQGRRHGRGTVSTMCELRSEFDVEYHEGSCNECKLSLENEVRRLREVVGEMESTGAKKPAVAGGGCSVCYSSAVEVVFRPCNHATLCGNCDRRLRGMAGLMRCPVCRQLVRQSEKIILHGSS